jgi:hypothetical protein
MGDNWKVIFDIQDSKVSREIYENDSKWSCTINNIRLTCIDNSKSIEQVSCDTVFCSDISLKQINSRSMSSKSSIKSNMNQEQIHVGQRDPSSSENE